MKKLLRYFIPASLPADEDIQRKARLTVGTLLIIAYFNIHYIIISWLIPYPGGLLSQIPNLIFFCLYHLHCLFRFLYQRISFCNFSMAGLHSHCCGIGLEQKRKPHFAAICIAGRSNIFSAVPRRIRLSRPNCGCKTMGVQNLLSYLQHWSGLDFVLDSNCI